MMTRVIRVENPFKDIAYGNDAGDSFDKRMSKIEENFPVSKGQDVSWGTEEGEYFSKMSRVLALIEGKSDVIDIDQATKIDRKAVISALKGVQAACRAVDDIVSGRFKQIVCAIKARSLEESSDESAAYNVFGNAALAAHYALSKKSINRVAIIDFNVDHGDDLKELITRTPDILLVSASMGAHKKDGDEQSMPGNIVEIILPKICHKDDIEEIFDNRIGSRVEEFKPDIILLSLRPDSEIHAESTTVGGEYVNEKIFALAQKTSNGRYVCILEGIKDDKDVDPYRREGVPSNMA